MAPDFEMKAQKKRILNKAPVEAVENVTIDLTKASLQKNNDVLPSLPRPCLVEGSGTSGDAVCLAREVYNKFSNNEQFMKTIKIANCMKYMNIEGHPLLLNMWYMKPLVAQAEALGVRVVEAPSLCVRTVGMSRTLPKQLVADQEKMMQVSAPRHSSMRFLYVVSASEIAAQLHSRELTGHVAARKQMLQGQITVLILDCDNYFKKGKPQNDLEMAIIDMLVTLSIDTLVVHSPEELSTVILQFTKAVAEEPNKLAKRMVHEQAEFYMRGDNKNCVTVDQHGNGSSNLWQQMLSVLPQSSLETSRAIAAEFPTPRLLADALSTDGGVSRLAAVGVARSAAPGARARRLGPELANKLKILFTTNDGQVVVE